jgi:hydroxymethylbilane synthase
MSSRIRIGTRGSKLALAQANLVALKLREEMGVEAELVVIRTTGDSRPGRHGGPEGPAAPGGKGVFVKEIQAALLRGEIELAVHSLKDLPAREPDGLCIAAIPSRADPSDALVSLDGSSLKDLPPGAVIGTSSLRRRAQILHFRPDLVIRDMRGNLDTRLRKLEERACHALIVAAAGMERLGMERRITERIPFEICLPAPGQGAIAVEGREDDTQSLALARAIDDPAAHAEARAERALVEALGADCQVPLGALARCEQGCLTLEAVVAAPDGRNLVRARAEGDPGKPEQLGNEGAEQLRAGGAEEILRQLAGRSG